MKKLSVYTILFNWRSTKYNIAAALKNYSKFAAHFDGEVVVCINNALDNEDTYEKVNSVILSEGFTNVTTTSCSIPKDNPQCIGLTKEAALRACVGEIALNLDFDERVSLNNMKEWRKLINALDGRDDFDCVFVPSLNLYKDFDNYFKINHKWYLHKNLENIHRGAFSGGIRDDGSIIQDKSDTCELIYSDGSLVKTATIVPERISKEHLEAGCPFVWHIGHALPDSRVETNKAFNEIFEFRTGGNVTDRRLEDKEALFYSQAPVYFEHGLPLWEGAEEEIQSVHLENA